MNGSGLLEARVAIGILQSIRNCSANTIPDSLG
jgi:hypothetical protein